MVGDCPPDFLELAISCCNVRNLHINSLNCYILLKIIHNRAQRVLKKNLLNEQELFKCLLHEATNWSRTKFQYKTV